MAYKIKSLFTDIAVILGIALLVILAFQVLAYVIPVVFIIWAIKWSVKKIKGTVHEKEHVTHKSDLQNKNQHIEAERQTFDSFNSNNSKVIDVEYEEVN